MGCGRTCKELLKGIIYKFAVRLRVPLHARLIAIALFNSDKQVSLLGSRWINAASAAYLYIACRMNNTSRPLKEFVTVSGSPKKDVARCFRLIVKSMDLRLEVVNASHFMRDFCAKLHIQPYIETASVHITKRALENPCFISLGNPVSLAAAAIYLASLVSSERKSAMEISEATGVSVIAIRRVYRVLLPKAVDLFPVDFPFQIPVQMLPNL